MLLSVDAAICIKLLPTPDRRGSNNMGEKINA
jgi:hypothetical protein